ncbi:MAG TPA: glycosyltransferase family 39 protein [Cryobacterium sp.]|nr:glycosyltransferase family 39 protein [Cryobacterium sp.]
MTAVEAPPEPPKVTARPLWKRVVGRTSHLWPALVLFSTVLVIWGRPVLDDFAHKRLSNPGDSESFAYYLSWNAHAFVNFVDPFFAPNLYAPDGLDLGNAISIPAVSLLVSPVALAFGGTAAYNAAFLLAIFLCGLCVYLLARELFGSVVGATAAGLLAVVSPYFSAHALGHLNLMWIFGLPLIAYLSVRAVKGSLRMVWLAVGVALTVGFTGGASTELMVVEAVFAALALVVAFICATPEVRSRLTRVLPWMVGGVVGGAVLALPVVLAALRSGIPKTVGNPPALYSTEVTNIFVPTSLVRFGAEPFAAARSTWVGNEAENSAYLPFVFLVFLVVYLVFARGRVVAGIGIFAVATLILSFGPYLTINGRSTIAMPWLAALSVPGLDHALPSRFTGFVFMALCLFVAHAWAQRIVNRAALVGIVFFTFVLLIPDIARMGFPTNASDPEFVTSGEISTEIQPGDNVLVLPAGQWGPGMRWVDELDFSFDMPTGNGGGAKAPEALADPVGEALFFRNFEFDYASTFEGYLDEYDVDTILIEADRTDWKKVVDESIDVIPTLNQGVWIYEINESR